MKQFHIYTSGSSGNPRNCIYPIEVAINGETSFKKAVSYDHVCAKYRDDRRSNSAFLNSDCIMMDCDNTHSEDPAEWKTPEDVKSTFRNAAFAVCYSRNHMKEKNGKDARPKFHVYFPISNTTDRQRYIAMKQQIAKMFPWFDTNAMDAARFFFGVENPQVKFYDSKKTVDELFLFEGERNSTLSKKAAKLVKRYGVAAEVRQMFQTEVERCIPLLPADEIQAIWNSAAKFSEKIAADPNYIPPEQYKASVLAALKPEDNNRYPWTELGAGTLFADCYKDVVRYVPQRKSWYYYADGVWNMDTGGIHTLEYCKELAKEMMQYAFSIQDEHKRQDFMKYCSRWQALKMRETIIKDAQSVYPIDMSEFDRDPYAFNCENGTLHLDTMEFTEHRASDMLTKKSNVTYNPKAQNARFDRFVDEITNGDKELAKFLQKILGYSLSGDTRIECLYILYGATTRNGKGTLCESVLNVLGSYGCAAQPGTIAVKKNTNSQMPSEDVARLAGVRFVNVAEPESGLLLNAALVKSMTGNDTLTARFLHENSFDFKPKFKIYINTNHLPTVNDKTLFTSGRVMVIPFERHFDDAEQDKNLKSLFSTPDCQSAILNWLIEGFKMITKEGLNPPAKVNAAITEYLKDSDKVLRFAEECLLKEDKAEVRTAGVYQLYKKWCEDNGCRAENAAKFKQALQGFASVERKCPRAGGSETTMLIGYKIDGQSQPL